MTNYWKMDQSGTSFTDTVGGINATCSGSGCPTSTVGRDGNALSFDGIDDGASAPSNALFNWTGDSSFSIELMMKSAGCAGESVIVGRRGTGSMEWSVSCSTGKARFSLSDSLGTNVVLTSDRIIADSKWHHIAVVRNASTDEVALYVDGVKERSSTVNYTGNFQASTTLDFGHLDSTKRFSGTIDELAIYSAILPEQDIRTHYYIPRSYCGMCEAPLRIMPLGDSITDGYGPGIEGQGFTVGYRKKLFFDLLNEGYDIDFVGSLNSGFSVRPGFDTNHEGHGGWCAAGCSAPYDDIVNHVYDFLTARQPDVVLLHIGTNDIGARVQNAQSVMAILDEIDRYSEEVVVVLARIIKRLDASDATTEFNDAVEALALDRIEAGDKIILVDQETALNYVDDMDSDIHPNALGYDKMAVKWLNALRISLPVCGAISPRIVSTPVTSSPVGQPYQYDVEAVGNPAPTFSLTSPPAGMSINQNTGVISWTPAQIGNYTVTVVAENGSETDTQSFTLSIVNAQSIWIEAEQGILTAPMAAGTDIDASEESFIWTPEGTGDVSDPTQPAGTAVYNFNVTVEGNYVVWGRVKLDPSGANNGFFVSMDDGPEAVWSTTQGPETWAWDPVNNNGAADPVVYSLSAGPHQLRIKQRQDGSKIDMIMITNDLNFLAPAHPLIVSSPVVSAITGQPYTYDVEAFGNPAPVFSLDQAPAGMTIDASTGLISWTPSSAGNFTVKVWVENSEGIDVQKYTISIPLITQNIWLEGEDGIAAAPMAVGTELGASNEQFVWTPQGAGSVYDPSQDAGTVDYFFNIVETGNYAVWGRVKVDDTVGTDNSFFVSMDAGSDTVWTTPMGTSSWVWSQVNSGSEADPIVYPLTAGLHHLRIKQREDGTKLDLLLITNNLEFASPAHPLITSIPVGSATVGQPYSYDVEAHGEPAPVYSLTQAPEGMTINPSTGVISWTPTAAGDFPVDIWVENSEGIDVQSYTLRVGNEIMIWLEAETASLTSPMTVGTDPAASSNQFIWTPDGTGSIYDSAQAGGIATYSFSVPVAGNYVVWARVMTDDTGGLNDSFYVSMDSNPYGLWDSLQGPAGWAWDMVNDRNIADPVLYSLTAGAHQLKIKQREDGAKIDRILITNDLDYVPSGTGDIPAALPQIQSTPVTSGAIGQLYNYDVDAVGTPAPTYRLSISPAGMTINSTTGLISWTPMQGGAHSVTVVAESSYGADSQSFTITVNDSVQIWLEAESGATSSPMAIDADAAASSGQYVWTPNGAGSVYDPAQPAGTIVFSFNAPANGNYVVWGRVMADETVGLDNSFFVSMDSGPETVWSTPMGPAAWVWDRASNVDGADPVVYSLSAGVHQLRIKQREDGTKIDRILITNDLDFIPQSEVVIVSTPAAVGSVGESYTYDVNAVGNPSPTYRLESPPEGMTINPVSGLISWTPAQGGEFNVTVVAENGTGNDRQTYRLTVRANVQIWLEAEAGVLTAPMTVGVDSKASEEQFVWTPNGAGNVYDPAQPSGSVVYTFEAPAPGSYVVLGRVKVDETVGVDNSFFVSMDSGPESVWSTPLGPSSWVWDQVNNGDVDPVIYSLSAGTHQLRIRQREDGAQIDMIYITNNLDFQLPQHPMIVSIPTTSPIWKGQPYTYAVEAFGNPAPLFSLVEAPAGMIIDQHTGVITWTPSVAGNFPVTVWVENSEGIDVQSFTVSVESDVYIWLEAETGNLTSPMAIRSDATASSGKYITVPNGSGSVFDPAQPAGTAVYSFSVPVAGNYGIWGRVMVDDTVGLDNSFFVSIDSGPEWVWTTPLGPKAWAWDLVNDTDVADPVVVILNPGTHQLRIKQREDGTQIDRILITNDPFFIP